MLSLLGLVPAAAVAQVDDDDPVLVHLTVCRRHLRASRRYLSRLTVEPVDTYLTEHLLREWAGVQALMEDTPVLRAIPVSA